MPTASARAGPVLIAKLPIFPAAEMVIRFQPARGQTRAVSQIEVGKLRFPGVQWGGTEYGLRRSPRAYSYRKEEPDGSSTLLYGSTYDMSGRVVIIPGRGSGADPTARIAGQGYGLAPTLGKG
ncbi:hypothetical protein J4711_14010 [Staphylococcus epidermidis]|nr:hypothetical protein [Staphylococcus epidermidis]